MTPPDGYETDTVIRLEANLDDLGVRLDGIDELEHRHITVLLKGPSAPHRRILEAVGALQHLRPGGEALVQAPERVPDHEGVIGGDDGGGPDRVRIGQVGLRHEAENAAGGLGEGGARQGCGGP